MRSIYSIGSRRSVLIFSQTKKLFIMYQPRMNPLTKSREYHLSSKPPICRMAGSIFQCIAKYSIAATKIQKYCGA
jgi:hypothetical protein